MGRLAVSASSPRARDRRALSCVSTARPGERADAPAPKARATPPTLRSRSSPAATSRSRGRARPPRRSRASGASCTATSCSGTSREPRRRRLAEVRSLRRRRLLHLPRRSLVGEGAPGSRVHDHERRQQPRHGLRPGRAERDDGRAARRAPRLRRPSRPDRGRPAGGVKVAFIGVAPYPWAQSLLDIPGPRRSSGRRRRRRTS